MGRQGVPASAFSFSTISSSLIAAMMLALMGEDDSELHQFFARRLEQH
jgi:hypothetical protein